MSCDPNFILQCQSRKGGTNYFYSCNEEKVNSTPIHVGQTGFCSYSKLRYDNVSNNIPGKSNTFRDHEVIKNNVPEKNVVNFPQRSFLNTKSESKAVPSFSR